MGFPDECTNENGLCLAHEGPDSISRAHALMQSVTAPYDPRFPNRNQARHCFVRFNEYHKWVGAEF